MAENFLTTSFEPGEGWNDVNVSAFPVKAGWTVGAQSRLSIDYGMGRGPQTLSHTASATYSAALFDFGVPRADLEIVYVEALQGFAQNICLIRSSTGSWDTTTAYAFHASAAEGFSWRKKTPGGYVNLTGNFGNHVTGQRHQCFLYVQGNTLKAFVRNENTNEWLRADGSWSGGDAPVVAPLIWVDGSIASGQFGGFAQSWDSGYIDDVYFNDASVKVYLPDPATPYLRAEINAKSPKFKDAGRTLPATVAGDVIAATDETGPETYPLTVTAGLTLALFTRDTVPYPAFQTSFNAAGIELGTQEELDISDEKASLFLAATGSGNGLLWQNNNEGPGSGNTFSLYEAFGAGFNSQAYEAARADGRVNVGAIMRERVGSNGATGIGALFKSTVFQNDSKPVRRWVTGAFGGANWMLQKSGGTAVHVGKIFTWENGVDAPLTLQQVFDEMEYVADQFGDTSAPVMPTYDEQVRIFWRGDSRTEGTSLGRNTYPNKSALIVDTALGYSPRHYLGGVYGQGSNTEITAVEQILGNSGLGIPSQLATGAGAKNVFIYWIGINDMRDTAGDNSAVVWNNVKAWCTKVRAACAAQGTTCRIILCTEVQGWTGYTDNTTMKAYTAKVRAEALSGGYADAIADLDADTVLGDPASFNPQGVEVGGVVIASDGIHLTASGNTRVAAIVAPVVLEMVALSEEPDPEPLAPGVLSAPTGATTTSLTGIVWTPATEGEGTKTAQLQQRLTSGVEGDYTDVAGQTASPAAVTGITASTTPVSRTLRVRFSDESGDPSVYSNEVVGTPSAAPNPGDTTPPTLATATINAAGNLLTLPYSEAVQGVIAGDYALSTGQELSAASGTGANRTMTITPPVLVGETPALIYTPGGTEDLAGNDLAAIAAGAITNNSTATEEEPEPTDTTPPTLTIGPLDATGLLLPVVLSEAGSESATGLQIRVNGILRSSSLAWSSPTAGVITLGSPVYEGQSVTAAYNTSSGNLTDTAGNEVQAFTLLGLTNNSTVEAPAPAPSTGAGGFPVSLPLAVSSLEGVSLREGDNGPARVVQLIDSQLRPYPIPDSATVIYRLKLRSVAGRVNLTPDAIPIEGAATVLSTYMGVVRFDFTDENPLPVAGSYNEEWIIDDTAGTTGQKITFPGDGYVPVTIRAPLT